MLLRGVQRAEAARRQVEHDQLACNSSTPPLCPLLYYTPQLWRDQHVSDRYTLRLAHVTPARPAFTGIAFLDVYYNLVDSRSLSMRGPARAARLAADVRVGSVNKLELPGIEVHTGEAVRVLAAYRIDSRECNDAPTVLFVN